MNWRWDQGRLDYFQLEEIQRIAQGLSHYDGKVLPKGSDPDSLRAALSAYSERPFLPEHYKVWRNYKRVFGCLMLATEVGGILTCTELGKKVASGSINGDDYLLHISRYFYYPSPVFEDYDPSAPQVWPICAIVKYLVASFVYAGNPTAALDDIIDRVQGNGCDGTEPLEAYAHLATTGHSIPSSDDGYRQVRELLRFISQFSFLKWDNPYLLLDVASVSEAMAIAKLFEPHRLARLYDASSELLQLGQAGVEAFPEVQPLESVLNVFDAEFAEGSRARALHLKIERSSKLRELYFARTSNPSVCDMCSMDTLDHYPWSNRLIEVHHLLPLSSPLKVERQSTSLKDVVGLCPTCHRATHKFYSEWLNDRSLTDFRDQNEAKAAYELAKRQYAK
jgi:hypothetical protein